jgi:DeoR family suf operon transcriptional repressor
MPLTTVPETRREILVYVKKHGSARADELAGALGITASAVRPHLSSLESDGLLAHRTQRSGPGRPGHVYTLTESGDALFPKTYGELTTELLGYLDEASVDRVFEQRRRRRAEQARARLHGLTFAAQVTELARILDEDGYLASAEPQEDGSYRIVEGNCAIFGVARRYGQACSSEIGFLRDVLPEATVERVSHMVAGQHTCAYEIRRRPPLTPKRRSRPK